MSSQKIDVPLFNGEFGFEIDFAIPYAYALYKKNMMKSITCYEGMYDIYAAIFPKELIRTSPDGKRTDGRTNWSSIVDGDGWHIKPATWLAPNFKGKFSNISINQPDTLNNNKPYLIIFNKYNTEWGENPVNYIPNDMLNNLYDKFVQTYNVIIIHPQQARMGFTEDNSKIINKFDYAHRLTLDTMLDMNPDIPYNLMQMILCDRSSNFISIQGGTSRIASLFGGTNLILHLKGMELAYREYETKISKLSSVELHIARYLQQLDGLANELFS